MNNNQINMDLSCAYMAHLGQTVAFIRLIILIMLFNYYN